MSRLDSFRQNRKSRNLVHFVDTSLEIQFMKRKAQKAGQLDVKSAPNVGLNLLLQIEVHKRMSNGLIEFKCTISSFERLIVYLILPTKYSALSDFIWYMHLALWHSSMLVIESPGACIHLTNHMINSKFWIYNIPLKRHHQLKREYTLNRVTAFRSPRQYLTNNYTIYLVRKCREFHIN